MKWRFNSRNEVLGSYCDWSRWSRGSPAPRTPAEARCAASPSPLCGSLSSCGKPWTVCWSGRRTRPGPGPYSSPGGTAALRPLGNPPRPGHSPAHCSMPPGSSPGPTLPCSGPGSVLQLPGRPGRDPDPNQWIYPSCIPEPDHYRPSNRSPLRSMRSGAGSSSSELGLKVDPDVNRVKV